MAPSAVATIKRQLSLVESRSTNHTTQEGKAAEGAAGHAKAPPTAAAPAGATDAASQLLQHAGLHAAPRQLLMVLHGKRADDPLVREAVQECRVQGHEVREQDRRSPTRPAAPSPRPPVPAPYLAFALLIWLPFTHITGGGARDLGCG